jgi:dihydroxy-acid dehydratase
MPVEFNTITIHDGITMGTQGMKASLISREVIADSIELVTRGNSFDGLVCIAGCDKNMPASIMALARLDIPGLMLYGGSIAPGNLKQPDGSNKEITILSVFEGMGAHAAGKINDDQLEALEAAACPGPGACGGQFTANTMAMAGEFLGISPMMLSGVPAMSPEKHEASRAAGRMVMDLARTRRQASATSSPASPSRTPSPPSPHPEAAPTPSSTSSPSRTSSRSPSPWRTSTASPSTRPSSATSPPAASTRPRTTRTPAARAPRCAPAQRNQLHDGPTVSGRTMHEEAALAVETPGQPVIYNWVSPAQSHRRPRHPARQPRPRRLRHQGRRPRAPAPHRHRPRLRK